MTEPLPEQQPEPTEPEPSAPTPDEETEDEEAEQEGEPSEAQPPEGEPPPESEPDEPQGLSPEELEKRSQKLDKAFDTYSRAVGRILEDDAVDLVPLYISPSAPPGFLHPADAGHVPDEVKSVLMSFLGITQEVEYPEDRTKPACDKCQGLGKVQTGSQVPEYRTLICDRCQGRGYIAPGVGAANGPVEAVSVPALVGTTAGEIDKGDNDDWGHPRLLGDGMPNPNYGKMPAYTDPQFP